MGALCTADTALAARCRHSHRHPPALLGLTSPARLCARRSAPACAPSPRPTTNRGQPPRGHEAFRGVVGQDFDVFDRGQGSHEQLHCCSTLALHETSFFCSLDVL
ncbi:hypothetical protein BU14_0345s0007 [Porphyra umbilicalis]|uniref:Uncharacterized protein n=1 Tax=Porphyra umbilicalis TaxID=2786 RepID=A0A1X6NY55_PORUM|nr:hypothetical protein BU14_0345s0007 [Porphyra umbilicalis]|eukprot:OSX73475.1 hypothetical protein BU14_0345s0007 [Porphyra umbilicalis]